MPTEDSSPALDPEHLTRVLRRAGVLAGGRVSGAETESARDTLISRIARVRLAYEGDADGAPARLFLKTARAGGPLSGAETGRREVRFYDQAAAATPPGLLPRCYEAAWHPDARFHAHWWNDRRLGVSVGTFLDTDGQLDVFLRELPGQVARFADRLGDRFSAERRGLYERLIVAAPRLLERYRTHRDLSIVNGDAHVWNVLYPREASSADVRLIDWSGWRVDTATDDLAYMMALHWYPERRRRLESPLLDRYHAALVAHGVTGYDRRALADDYRASVLWQLTTPVWQADHDLPPIIWWSHLERILLAVDDLGCRDLLG